MKKGHLGCVHLFYLSECWLNNYLRFVIQLARFSVGYSAVPPLANYESCPMQTECPALFRSLTTESTVMLGLTLTRTVTVDGTLSVECWKQVN